MDKPVIFLLVISMAVFGAGIADVVFTDVVPVRPYTVFFQAYDTASFSQASHQAHRVLAPPMTGLIIALLIVVALASLLVYHVAIIVPLGARGSHSRANRRARSGWKTASEERASVRDQFRILREIFGDPRMVIIYERNDGRKPKGKPSHKPNHAT